MPEIKPKPAPIPNWYVCGQCGAWCPTEQSAIDCCKEKPGQHSRASKTVYQPKFQIQLYRPYDSLKKRYIII